MGEAEVVGDISGVVVVLALEAGLAVVEETVSDVEPGGVVEKAGRSGVVGVAGRRLAGVEDAETVELVEDVVVVAATRKTVAVGKMLKTLPGPAEPVAPQLETHLAGRTGEVPGETPVVVIFVRFAGPLRPNDELLVAPDAPAGFTVDDHAVGVGSQSARSVFEAVPIFAGGAGLSHGVETVGVDAVAGVALEHPGLGAGSAAGRHVL